MKNGRFKIGLIGTGVTALCCFTPILVIAFSGMGAGALIAYLDMVLFPLLGFFLILTAYGAYRWKRGGKAESDAVH